MVEQVDNFRDILTVNATLVTQTQTKTCNASPKPATPKTKNSKDLRLGRHPLRPTLIGTIYGMNFPHIPELHWTLGYPFALLLMAAVCASLYLIFKHRGWL
ncbi:MAG TPA: CorA family divalent cation transporter [Actinophytocola sp.]|uniref:CorA family divalent cation transporter n=1 Tax=Actinophytocola sp. TaxID=1872138 RepID=UPI002DFD42FE|nr:CorA family divalent cation transporter [Actinophytocola sp.]